MADIGLDGIGHNHSGNIAWKAFSLTHVEYPEELLLSVECPFWSEEHEGKEMASQLLPLPPKHIFHILYENENFMANIYKDKKYVDLVFSPWEKNPDTGDSVRTLTCTANLPSRALGPSSSNVTEVHTLSSASRENELYVVNTEISNGGIPYGESFKIYVHYCLTREAVEAPPAQTGCRFSCFCSVKFTKTTFFLVRGIIEKSAYEGVQAFAEDIASALVVEAERVTGVVDRRTEAQVQPEKHNRMNPNACGAGGSSPVRLWPALFLFLLLASIAVMNAFLYRELKGIEDLTRRRQALVGEDAPTPESLFKAPSAEAIEESLMRLRVQEGAMRTQFQRWKDRLALIFQAIDEAESELHQLLSSLPSYETEMLGMFSLQASTQNKNYDDKQEQHQQKQQHINPQQEDRNI